MCNPQFHCTVCNPQFHCTVCNPQLTWLMFPTSPDTVTMLISPHQVHHLPAPGLQVTTTDQVRPGTDSYPRYWSRLRTRYKSSCLSLRRGADLHFRLAVEEAGARVETDVVRSKKSSKISRSSMIRSMSRLPWSVVTGSLYRLPWSVVTGSPSTPPSSWSTNYCMTGEGLNWSLQRRCLVLLQIFCYSSSCFSSCSSRWTCRWCPPPSCPPCPNPYPPVSRRGWSVYLPG